VWASFGGVISSLSFDPSGGRLFASDINGVNNLWSVPGLQKIGTDLIAPHNDGCEAGAFAERGAALVKLDSAGHGFVWPATVAAWRSQACSVAGRNLTREEWGTFLPGQPYAKTCPGR
jgi:hypothetical protein